MTELAGWENFFVIVGSSAGALIGLQFVVITLVAAMPAFLGTSQHKERNASVMQEVRKPVADDIMKADPKIPSGSLSTGCDRVHMPT